MLEYFRMVGKGGGGKEKEEKKLEVETNKPIDTASLIAALHPFGQGGVKLCSTRGSCFPSPHLLALIPVPCTAQLCESVDLNRCCVIIACDCNFFVWWDPLFHFIQINPVFMNFISAEVN